MDINLRINANTNGGYLNNLIDNYITNNLLISAFKIITNKNKIKILEPNSIK